MPKSGLWSTLINLGLFNWALNSGRSQAETMTMTFVSLVLIQFFKAYNFRSDRLSVLDKPFTNKLLNLAVGWDLPPTRHSLCSSHRLESRFPIV
jgi:Ca2+-transporting ATPase